MSERDEKEPAEGQGEKRIHCRRTGRAYDPDEHRRCPYCFGAKATVEAGDHQEFCDYDPEKDPISFGFPPDSTRHQSG